MKHFSCVFLGLIMLLAQAPGFALPPASASASAKGHVTLQLKWRHAFQFAGYYAAQERGYYRQEGLEVEIREARPGLDTVDEVMSGRADFGIGTSSLLLERNAGKPVVALAVIFQHSAQVLIAAGNGVSQNIHDLAGKRLMLEPHSDELQVYLKRENIPLASIRQQAHSFNLEDLIAGKTDASSSYLTNEPYHLDQAKFPYQIYTPRSAGIDFYGDTLFTSEHAIDNYPDRVKAFRAASLRGWDYAMLHPEEIIDLMLKKYSREKSREMLSYEATAMIPLLRTDLIVAGYMNPGRWQHIADVYAEAGMLPDNFSFDGFLYDPDPKRDLTWLYVILAAVLGGSVLAGSIAFYIYRINQELKRRLAELRQTELQLKIFSIAVEQAPTSVIITGPDNIIEYVNPKFTSDTGYSSAEALGKTPSFLQSGLTERATYEAMWNHLRRGQLWTGELVNQRKSGEIYWEEVHIAPVKNRLGEVCNYVAVKLDITERKRAHERLKHLAHYDVLTNLPNRVLFFERVTQGISLAKRNKTMLTLMYLDFDKFKPINDTYGHAVGDLVLQEAAMRMSGCLRESDTVGRIGGDEFVVLLLDIGSEENAFRMAEKIRIALNQPCLVAGETLSISSSIGVVLYPAHGHDGIELAKLADIAMYDAKAGGRDKVVVYHAGMGV